MRSRTRQAVGLMPVTRENSRLKLDFVMKPAENRICVTGWSVSLNRRQASSIRRLLTYCETLMPCTRLTALETALAGTKSRRAKRNTVSSGLR